MGRICKQSSLKDNGLEFTEDLVSSENRLKLTEIVVEDNIKKKLVKVSEKDKLFFLKGVQNHYMASAKQIMEKSSLSSSLLKSVSCLQPKERLSEKSYDKIVAISKAIPWEIKTDMVLDEWELLQREVDKPDSHKLPIDQYWNQLFELKDTFGNPRYPTISKIVQAVLYLSHGNPDVERGFSASGPVGLLLLIEVH